jgi:hypothetical protein
LNAILTLHFAQEDELYTLLAAPRMEGAPEAIVTQPEQTTA